MSKFKFYKLWPMRLLSDHHLQKIKAMPRSATDLFSIRFLLPVVTSTLLAPLLLGPLFLTPLFLTMPVMANEQNTKALVYTELQISVPFNQVPWKKLNPVIKKQKGFISKTWFSGLDNGSVGGIYSFDSIENAQKYVNEFFPAVARKQGVAHNTRIFDATITREASRELNSVYSGGKTAIKPGAFVYTELQVSLPFAEVPWRKRNPYIKKEKGLLSKTWLSGIKNNSVGGIYAFDTIENAKEFALNSFPRTAAKFNAAFYTRIFDGSVVEQASRGMSSPFYKE